MAALFISAAFAVRNGMPLVKNTIEALRRQTYRNFELVVQDGASTDGTVEYLRSLDEGFPIHIVSEPDGNLVEGYGRAWQRCSGDLVMSVACDEALQPDAFETYVRWYEESPDAVFIYGGSRLVDAAGATISEFHPPAFDLLSYLRHDMCPTMAGPFNRRALGEEAYVDQSLSVVPDFELMCRLALRFGDARIQVRPDVTMSARGDAVSRSFDPRNFMTFAETKKVVIERMLTGPWRDAFTDYLRRDFSGRMHAVMAAQLGALEGGEGPQAEHVLAAAATGALLPQLQSLTLANRRLVWNSQAAAPEPRPEVPAPPAEDAPHQPQAFALSAAVACGNPGAAVAIEDDGGLLVTTPGDQGAHAALLPLDFSAVDLEAGPAWLAVRLGRCDAPVALALYDQATGKTAHETPVFPKSGPQSLLIELKGPPFDRLLVRNRAEASPARVVIAGVDLYSDHLIQGPPLHVRIGRSHPLSADDRGLLRAVVDGLAAGDPPKGWERLALELAAIAEDAPTAVLFGLDEDRRTALANAARGAIDARAALAAEPPVPRGPQISAATRLCSAWDWQDPAWSAMAQRLFGPDSLQLRSATRWMWERVSLALAVSRGESAGPVLVVAPAPDLLAPFLMSLGRDVLFATPGVILDGAAPDPDWNALIEKSWLPLTGRAAPWSGRHSGEVVIINLDPGGEALLQAIAPADGETLHASASVQLNARAYAGALSFAQWRGAFEVDGLLGGRGLAPIGEVDRQVPLDTLVRFALNDDAGETIPGLSAGFDDSLFTSAVFAARRTAPAQGLGGRLAALLGR